MEINIAGNVNIENVGIAKDTQDIVVEKELKKKNQLRNVDTVIVDIVKMEKAVYSVIQKKCVTNSFWKVNV